MLKNKTVGYYLGRFDPVTLGNEEAIQKILQNKWCEYILVYPLQKDTSLAPGNRKEKRGRAPLSERLTMLFALFAKHPRVIVTALPPVKVQELLMQKKPQDNELITKRLERSGFVQSRFPGTKYISILNEIDVIILLKGFGSSVMKGIKLPVNPKYPFMDSLWEEAINIPTSGAIVVHSQSNHSPTNWVDIEGTPVVGHVKVEYPDEQVTQEILSVLLKEKIDPSPLVSPRIRSLIKKHDYYKRPFHPSYNGPSPLARKFIESIKLRGAQKDGN